MLANTITHQGYALLTPILPPPSLTHLSQSIPPATHALRRLASLIPQVREFAESIALRQILHPILGPRPRLVRSLLFNKSPGVNWLVPWHQDLTIAVERRIDTPGFGPWSIKDGVAHVQPPLHILQSMLTVRLHLDPATPDNGPLRVIPGSHRQGLLTDAAQIAAVRQQLGEQTILQPAGGILLMRPLLLHASSKATTPTHRRIIHLEFATEDLPNGLEWTEG